MHGWGTVDLRIYLASKIHCYSILAQSYDFCPHLKKLDILDFTLSPTGVYAPGNCTTIPWDTSCSAPDPWCTNCGVYSRWLHHHPLRQLLLKVLNPDVCTTSLETPFAPAPDPLCPYSGVCFRWLQHHFLGHLPSSSCSLMFFTRVLNHCDCHANVDLIYTKENCSIQLTNNLYHHESKPDQETRLCRTQWESPYPHINFQ